MSGPAGETPSTFDLILMVGAIIKMVADPIVGEGATAATGHVVVVIWLAARAMLYLMGIELSGCTMACSRRERPGSGSYAAIRPVSGECRLLWAFLNKLLVDKGKRARAC